ncbi:MAG: class I SAM-dependent methyltransferase [Spirochaetota bacterium]
MLENTPSRTAEVVALIRALEYAYYGEKSLLKDKYAARFLSDFYMAIYNRLSILPEFMSFFVNSASLGLFDFITLRHAFMDDYTRRLAQKIPVAVLGAGYDSRALRLAHQIKHGIWEFDFPATQRRKKFYLRNERIEGEVPHYCEVDFMKEPLPEILERSGIPKTAALVIWEGVSMYVSEDVVKSTLLACRDYFGEGTIVVFDYWHSTMDDPIRNMLVKIMPMVMDVIYSERFTYGATPQQMRELALSCGARRFESLTGKQIMKKLFLTSRLPLTSASMAVVEF